MLLIHTAEELGKFRRSRNKINFEKNCTSPVKEFLLHKCRNNRKIRNEDKKIFLEYDLKK